MTVLTLDLGTSATKGALWSGDELTAIERAPLATTYPTAARAEQRPEDWWRSVVAVCAALRVSAPDAYSAVHTLGCSGARETFACFDGNLHAISPGILWSDMRGAEQLRSFGDPAKFRQHTGVLLTGGCEAAKVAWVRQHEPTWFDNAAWILSPRDYVVARLTGSARTDPTLASRTGFYAIDGNFIGDRALAQRLPPIVPSLQLASVADDAELALPAEASVILGAGDRACEVVGMGATHDAPMVSWGTTVNVSVPLIGSPDAVTAAQISRAADASFLVEAGLSAGGSAIEWLASLTGWTGRALLEAAAEVPPGANGIFAFPWLHGARAPWWRAAARASFIGVTSAHGPPDLARALIEGVALDTARSVELLAPNPKTLALAGAGSRNSLWQMILAALTECSVTVRRHSEAATVGAMALATEAHGDQVDLGRLNPVVKVAQPQPALVTSYRSVRAASDTAADALLMQT